MGNNDAGADEGKDRRRSRNAEYRMWNAECYQRRAIHATLNVKDTVCVLTPQDEIQVPIKINTGTIRQVVCVGLGWGGRLRVNASARTDCQLKPSQPIMPQHTCQLVAALAGYL